MNLFVQGGGSNERAGRLLKEAFGDGSIREITADDIELYLRRWLQTRVQIKTGAGVVQKDRFEPATFHQELRVLRRMLIAVRKKCSPRIRAPGWNFQSK
jgi:hypothetical protein